MTERASVQWGERLIQSTRSTSVKNFARAAVRLGFALSTLTALAGVASSAPAIQERDPQSTPNTFDPQGFTAVSAQLAPPSAQAAASPVQDSQESKPVIVLDPGMHTGPIRRLAVSADETTLATASDDKSARLWDLASGRLLATLHPPAGPDQIGRLYGASISSDNRVALGGTTAASGGTHRIYLFDLLSYAFVKSFDARGGDIKRLAWSPDGKLLAAAYAGSPAVRVFDNQGGSVFEETLSGDAYYIAYSSTQRMAVSATDGRIHMYTLAGGRVTPDGIIKTSLNDPRGVQFSPDGKLLAVGYLSRQSRDSVRVDIFDVASRELARAFVFSDVPQGNLMNVAWRSDGRAVYVGGTGYQGKNRFVVKRISWPDGSIGDIDAGANSILDFAALRDGKIVFATAEPTWGLIEGDRVVKTIVAPTAQFYEASTLRINKDATEVSFSYRLGEAPVRFTLADRQVRDGAGEATSAAQSSTWKLQVSDWENNFNTKINGSAVKLDPTEVARASAVLPGNAGVVLGSSRSLRRFDPDGRERWSVSLPTEARAVNVTEDGKILVVAMLDGTIRWRRVADGALLMSLFTTRDRKWVVWTAPGYFDVSAGAENLVGWLVNRSNGEQADYYAISRFRNKFFRPDVIERVLGSADPIAALASANSERKERAESADAPVRERVEALIAPQPVETMLPPTLTLLSPAMIEAADTKVNVEYQLLSRLQEPVTSFSVRVDGRPHETFSNRLPSNLNGDSVGRLTLTLPERDSQVQIFAGNKSGVSAPVTLSYRWRAPAPPARVAAAVPKPPAPVAAAVPTPAAPVATVTDRRPRLFLLSVGVSRYANSKYDLYFAAKDATDFAQTLLRQNGKFYRQVDVQLLTNERATRVAVLEGLKWLKSVATPDDVGMLYLAGHGLNDVDDTYYFLSHEVDLKHLDSTAVGEDAFRDVLTGMRGKSIFFVDTCYSGKSVGIFSNQDLTRIANKFSSPESGVIVFSASHGRQESLEKRDWGNGAFTKALLEGLLGRADYRKEGIVTHMGLDYFVSDAVKKLTAGLQTPVTSVPVGLGDFGLAKVFQD